MSLTTLEPAGLPSLSTPSDARSSGFSPAAVTIIVFAALSLLAAATSPGFLEADSCTHYLYARAAWAHPAYIANVWGRPICTALYALPAHLGGRLAVRATSMGVAVALALVAREIARGQEGGGEMPRAPGAQPALVGRSGRTRAHASNLLKRVGPWAEASVPTLALLCTLAQPLVFLHSFSELTELPFALLVALAFWAYQRRQFFLLASVVAVMPLSRPEGFGFLALAAIALLLHRRARWLVLLPIPLILWDYAGWRVSGGVGAWPGAFPFFPWLRANWPYAETSLYQRGPLLHFVLLMPVVTSPLLLPAAVAGIGLCLRPWRRFFSSDHRARCDVLIAAIPLLVMVGHSLLYWRGKMASNGELRYLLVVAVFWGLLSGRGWAWLFGQMRWSRPIAWAATAALVPIGINRCYRVVPIRSQPDWVEAEQIARWYAADGRTQRYPHLLVAHPGVIFYLDGIPAVAGRAGDWSQREVDRAEPGTLLIWDPIYGVFNSDRARSVPLAEVRAHGWKPLVTLWDGPGSAGGWKAFVSPAAK